MDERNKIAKEVYDVTDFMEMAEARQVADFIIEDRRNRGQTMCGQQLIDKIVKSLKKDNRPPSDSWIVLYLREMTDVKDDIK